MNSRKKLLRYLEDNNDINVNRDIYENYEKGYIKKRVDKWKNITSADDFISDYLKYIYESLETEERNDLQFQIQKVNNFLNVTSSETIYKERLEDLRKLLLVLLEHINVSLKDKSDKTVFFRLQCYHLLWSLSDTINCFFLMFPKGNVRIHKQNHLSKILCRISKKLQIFDNIKGSQRTLFENLEACLIDPNGYIDTLQPLESFELLLYNFDRNKGFQGSAESSYLRQLLILLTQNYLATFNSTSLLLNITGYEYIKQFINFIIFELKGNKDTEITYHYLNSIREFYLKTEFYCKRKTLLKDGSKNTLSRGKSGKVRFKEKRKENIYNDWWPTQPSFIFERDDSKWTDRLKLDPSSYIHKDPEKLSEKERKKLFKKEKIQLLKTNVKELFLTDTKELFLTLVLNYKGFFSNNARLILKRIQTCPFWKVYDLISLIPNFKEREYIRQTFESIIRYLENNNCVDIKALWIANISLENFPKTNTVQQSINDYRLKPSCNLVITLGFSKEVERIEDNDVLEVSKLEPFYVPIYYRGEKTEGEF